MSNTRAQPAPAAANSAANDGKDGCICCLICLATVLMAIIVAGSILGHLFKAHSDGPRSPPPPAQVQLASALVSSSNTTSSLLDDAVWLLTLRVEFPHATTATVVHYDSFRASVLFDSGGGRGQLEMAAAAALPTPFDAKGDSTFNLRLESKPAAEKMSVQDRMVVGPILDDMVAAGSVDFGVQVVTAVRVDAYGKKKKSMVATVRADCRPVRIGFSDPHDAAGSSTPAEGLSGSLPISITCNVH